MARPLTLRIAIADGEHARFVQPDADNVLRTVGALDSAVAHQRSHDLGADRPGRSTESGGPVHHAVGQKHDLHVMAKESFLRLVAQELNAGAARGEFDELLIVAPPRGMQDLREALNSATEQKLVGVLEKDLVKTPDHELWAHVKEWVSPARRATND